MTLPTIFLGKPPTLNYNEIMEMIQIPDSK